MKCYDIWIHGRMTSRVFTVRTLKYILNVSSIQFTVTNYNHKDEKQI
jgi:hypothetical protein